MNRISSDHISRSHVAAIAVTTEYHGFLPSPSLLSSPPPLLLLLLLLLLLVVAPPPPPDFLAIARSRALTASFGQSIRYHTAQHMTTLQRLPATSPHHKPARPHSATKQSATAVGMPIASAVPTPHQQRTPTRHGERVQVRVLLCRALSVLPLCWLWQLRQDA